MGDRHGMCLPVECLDDNDNKGVVLREGEVEAIPPLGGNHNDWFKDEFFNF